MPADKRPLCRQVDIREGNTFAWGEQLLHVLEERRRKFSAPGVLLPAFGRSLLPLERACGLKDTAKAVKFP